MEEAMAHMSGSVKGGSEQTKEAMASATNAQKKVQHMGSNITSFKTTITEAAHGNETMCKELVRVEKREREDMMACMGGLQECKNIERCVTGETQGLQESDKTMQNHVMQVQEHVSELHAPDGSMGKCVKGPMSQEEQLAGTDRTSDPSAGLDTNATQNEALGGQGSTAWAQ